MTFPAFEGLRAVRALRGISSTDKLVLVMLILRADPRGECFPSFESIACDTGLSPRCAKTSIARLAKAGHISVERRSVEGRTTSNLYRVHVVHTGVNDVHTAVIEDHPGVTDVHGGSDLGAPPGVNDVHTISPLELPIELPRFALTRAEPAPESASKGNRKRRERKHSPGAIAAKKQILDVFIERFEAKKGVKPKVIADADHAKAFELEDTYGAEEACAIVRRAFEDPFTYEKSCTLRYIASRAETFRGRAPMKANGARHVVQRAAGPGEHNWREGNGT